MKPTYNHLEHPHIMTVLQFPFLVAVSPSISSSSPLRRNCFPDRNLSCLALDSLVKTDSSWGLLARQLDRKASIGCITQCAPICIQICLPRKQNMIEDPSPRSIIHWSESLCAAVRSEPPLFDLIMIMGNSLIHQKLRVERLFTR